MILNKTTDLSDLDSNPHSMVVGGKGQPGMAHHAF
jgi:hypothetical protein